MRKSTSGFTIVELMIVIIVIAILAAISIVAYTGIQERANITVAQNDLRNIGQEAANQFVIDGSLTRDELRAVYDSVLDNRQDMWDAKNYRIATCMQADGGTTFVLQIRHNSSENVFSTSTNNPSVRQVSYDRSLHDTVLRSLCMSTLGDNYTATVWWGYEI